MKVKKSILFVICLVITVMLAGICTYFINSLEYLTQMTAVDNLIGAAPLLILLSITGILIALIWKHHKDAIISTIVLSVLGMIFGLLFIPSITGNWFPLAKVSEFGSASPDMTVYMPFTENTQVARLPNKSSFTIQGTLPSLDGATALYPVYAAFVNAVYDTEDFSEDVLVCTNTPNAYKAIIAGDRDIIFVAGASEKQKQAAEDAGVELVFTPIGKEAFVFLVGKENPIDGLAYQQLKNIYSGKTSKWRTLGWDEGGNIIAFQRPEGSGSQTGLQNIIGSLPIQKPQPLPDKSLVGTGSMMKQVSVEWNGVQPAIGYSYRYYAMTMYPNPDSKLLAIDGIYPSSETITNLRVNG